MEKEVVSQQHQQASVTSGCGDCVHQQSTITLPARLLQHSAGLAFDMGGSRCKVAVASTPTLSSEQSANPMVTISLRVIGPSKSVATPAAALDFAKTATWGRGVYNQQNDLKKDRDQNSDLRKGNTKSSTNSNDSDVSGDNRLHRNVVRITGIAFDLQFVNDIQDCFNVKLQRLDEFSLTFHAVQTLLQHLPDDQLFQTTSNWVRQRLDRAAAKMAAEFPVPMTSSSQATPTASPEGSSSGDREPVEDGMTSSHSSQDIDLGPGGRPKPYLIVCVGSAAGYTLVKEDGSSALVCGVSQGGMSFHSLCSLLVGKMDHSELMALAERGDETRVSRTVKDIRPVSDDPNFYSALPDDYVMFPYVKAAQSQNTANREDIVRAVLASVTSDLSAVALFLAKAYQCRAIYLCGGFFEDQLPRDLFQLSIEYRQIFFRMRDMKVRGLKYSSFMPVLGAVLDPPRPGVRPDHNEDL